MIGPSLITEQDIIKRYVGVPFQERGRTIKGLDCWGLIVCIYRELGIELYDFQDYDITWDRQGHNYMAEHAYHDWRPVIRGAFPDLALFESSKSVANHVGMVLSGGRFLHCLQTGVVLQRMDRPAWSERFVGFYRHKAF